MAQTLASALQEIQNNLGSIQNTNQELVDFQQENLQGLSALMQNSVQYTVDMANQINRLDMFENFSLTEKAEMFLQDAVNLLDDISGKLIDINFNLTSLFEWMAGNRLQEMEDRYEQTRLLKKIADGISTSTDATSSNSQEKDEKKKKSFLDFLFPTFASISTGIGGLTLTGLGTKFVDMLKSIKTKIGSFFKSGFKKFKFVLKKIGILNTVFAAVRGVVDFIDAFKNTDGDFYTKLNAGIQKGLKTFVSDLVGIPLNLVKDITSWVARKLGFSEIADILDQTDFRESIGKTFEWIVDLPKKIMDWAFENVPGGKAFQAWLQKREDAAMNESQKTTLLPDFSSGEYAKLGKAAAVSKAIDDASMGREFTPGQRESLERLFSKQYDKTRNNPAPAPVVLQNNQNVSSNSGGNITVIAGSNSKDRAFQHVTRLGMWGYR